MSDKIWDTAANANLEKAMYYLKENDLPECGLSEVKEYLEALSKENQKLKQECSELFFQKDNIACDVQRQNNKVIMKLSNQNAALVEVLEKAYEKLKLECGGQREYKGITPTQFLFPEIEAALKTAWG